MEVSAWGGGHCRAGSVVWSVWNLCHIWWLLCSVCALSGQCLDKVMWNINCLSCVCVYVALAFHELSRGIESHCEVCMLFGCFPYLL